MTELGSLYNNSFQASVRVHSSCLPVPGVLQSTSSSCYTVENNHDSWCSDMLPGFLDYPMTAGGNSHTEGGNNSSFAGLCEDFSMPSGLLDQLLNSDDALSSNWDHTENNGFVNSQLQFPYQVPTLSMDHRVQPPLPHQHSQVYQQSRAFQQLPHVHEQFPSPSKEICTAQSTSHKVQQPQVHQQPLALQQPQIHEELPRASDEIRLHRLWVTHYSSPKYISIHKDISSSKHKHSSSHKYIISFSLRL